MQATLEKIGLREFRILLIGMGLVITSITTTAALVPKVKVYRSAATTVVTLEEAEQNSSDLERHLQDRQSEITELKYRLHGDMADLPIKEVEAYVIGRLQSISWHNEVELVGVEPSTGQQVQIFSEILFHVELIGEYQNIYRWLWDAKNELGFVVVKEYSLSRSDNIDDNPRLLAKVSLASYRAAE